MKKTTIERAFSLGLLCAEKIHGRGLQAEICRRTEVDSSNLNSIMKKEKGARETTRREIFNAVVDIVPELEGMDYEGFLSMGESIDVIGGDDIDFSQFKKTTTQTTTGNRSPAQQHVGMGTIYMDEGGITCTGLDERHPPERVDVDEWAELLYWLKRYPTITKRVMEEARRIGLKMDDAANG